MVEVVVVVTTTTKTRKTTAELLLLGVTFPARGKESGPRGYEARGESGCCRNGGDDGGSPRFCGTSPEVRGALRSKETKAEREGQK